MFKPLNMQRSPNVRYLCVNLKSRVFRGVASSTQIENIPLFRLRLVLRACCRLQAFDTSNHHEPCSYVAGMSLNQVNQNHASHKMDQRQYNR